MSTTKTKPVKLNTEALGKITLPKLKKLIKEAGSQRKLADQLNVSSSTVRNWALRLRKLNHQ